MIIHPIKATAGGTVLTGLAGEECRTGKTAVYPMESTGKNGDLMALGEGLAYRPGEAGGV
ncbi:MAG: hypothetical protein ACOX0T_03325 [Pelotomaculum sp.]